ncbi:hypothetical protein [uncultured Helicobacter sp.]|uniref:Uncharacterized protein n=1 Tax=Helicobacter fennelliae MRY12-0050 TaxID=1325130 RepID=T1DUX4_9HELI|nr:hypothetical protein HFN_1576 [Helicobacter fennelliae MRY12-0050]
MRASERFCSLTKAKKVLENCLLEAGGGYLVWIWLKEQKPLYLRFLGLVALSL